jgi:hypothetical protein
MPTIIVIVSSPSLLRPIIPLPSTSAAQQPTALLGREVIQRGVTHLLETFEREHTASVSGHNERIALWATTPTQSSKLSSAASSSGYQIAPFGDARTTITSLQHYLVNDLPVAIATTASHNTNSVPLTHDTSILSTLLTIITMLTEKYAHEASQIVMIIDRPIVEINHIQIAELRVKCYTHRIKLHIVPFGSVMANSSSGSSTSSMISSWRYHDDWDSSIHIHMAASCYGMATSLPLPHTTGIRSSSLSLKNSFTELFNKHCKWQPLGCSYAPTTIDSFIHSFT